MGIYEIIDDTSEISDLELVDSIFTFTNSFPNYCEPESGGAFVPHTLTGYIKETCDEEELNRRVIHEVSHGLYLENFPQGKDIVRRDILVAEQEKKLFGRLLGAKEKVLVIQDGEKGVYEIEELDDDTRKNIGEDLSNYDMIAFVPEGFKNYYCLREGLHDIVLRDLENQEGFCCLMEVEVLDKNGSALSKELKKGYAESDDVYGRGFRKMNNLKNHGGLECVVTYLGGVIDE